MHGWCSQAGVWRQGVRLYQARSCTLQGVMKAVIPSPQHTSSGCRCWATGATSPSTWARPRGGVVERDSLTPHASCLDEWAGAGDLEWLDGEGGRCIPAEGRLVEKGGTFSWLVAVVLLPFRKLVVRESVPPNP